MKTKALTAAVIVTAASVSTADAHPGPKLLTTGSGERTAMTPGISYEDVGGVHLFKGAPRLAGGEAVPAMSADGINITIRHKYPSRSFRTLRTQGFYAGTGPTSRRYTQGFYSGD